MLKKKDDRDDIRETRRKGTIIVHLNKQIQLTVRLPDARAIQFRTHAWGSSLQMSMNVNPENTTSSTMKEDATADALFKLQ